MRCSAAATATARPVLVVDDDRIRTGSELSGVPVVRGSGNILKLASDYRVDEIIIAIATPKGDLKPLIEKCLATGCRVRRLAPLQELAKRRRRAHRAGARRQHRRPAGPPRGAAGHDAGRRVLPRENRAHHRGRRVHPAASCAGGFCRWSRSGSSSMISAKTTCMTSSASSSSSTATRSRKSSSSAWAPSATRSAWTRSSRATGPRWCSMPPRTSTCPSWRTAPTRR